MIIIIFFLLVSHPVPAQGKDVQGKEWPNLFDVITPYQQNPLAKYKQICAHNTDMYLP